MTNDIDDGEETLEEFLRNFEHEAWCPGNSDLDENADPWTWPGHEFSYGSWSCEIPEHVSWCKDPDDEDAHDSDGCLLVVLLDPEGAPAVQMSAAPGDHVGVAVDIYLTEPEHFDSLINTLVQLKPVFEESNRVDYERY